MADEQKRKPGRPTISPTEAFRHRIVLMADDATRDWLNQHSTETGASVAEIIRRAVAAYRAAQQAAADAF